MHMFSYVSTVSCKYLRLGVGLFVYEHTF